MDVVDSFNVFDPTLDGDVEQLHRPFARCADSDSVVQPANVTDLLSSNAHIDNNRTNCKWTVDRGAICVSSGAALLTSSTTE